MTNIYGNFAKNPSARRIIDKAFAAAKKEGRYGGPASQRFEELTGIQGDYKTPDPVDHFTREQD